MPRAVIFANGRVPDLEKAGALLRPNDVILCANGGARYVKALGRQPHTVIGDLDSLSKEEIANLTSSGIQVELYPPRKDATDLALALRFADSSDFDPILIIGGLGGRLDQVLANIGLMGNPAYATRELRMDDGVEEVFFCRDRAVLTGRPGDRVSLIPWGGVAGGVRTENLEWPLDGDYLAPEESLGISNLMLGDSASVSISFGLLLIVHHRQETPEPASDGEEAPSP
jgi:thiamine pyrophosphokinase